jgi:hypothetical protein
MAKNSKKYSKLYDVEWLTMRYVDNRRTTKRIADEIGCSRGTVRNILIKLGITLRRYTTTKAVIKHAREAAKLGGRKPVKKK